MNFLRWVFIVFLLVAGSRGRPQLKLTPREYKAFQAALGKSRPISISSAIPVMAFTDKNPSKFVDLPVGIQLGGGSIGQLSEAGLIDVDEERSALFESAFGRGVKDGGPILTSIGLGQQHGIPGQVVFEQSATSIAQEDFIASAHDVGKFTPPSELSFGFRPISGARGSLDADFGIKATGNDVQKAFIPSEPLNFPNAVNLQPVKQVSPDVSIQSGLNHGTNENVNQELHQEAKTEINPIDIGIDAETIKNINAEISGLIPAPPSKPDRNLFRDHIKASLIPSSGASPRSNAVGKLLASRNSGFDDSSVVARSVDGVSKNKVNIITSESKSAESSQNINISSDSKQTSAVVGTSINVQNLSPEVNGTNSNRSLFGSTVEPIVQEQRKGSENSLNPSASIFDSSKFPTSSVFSTNSVGISNLPNVQLPLQTQEVASLRSEELLQPQRNTPHTVNSVSLEKFRIPSQNKFVPSARVEGLLRYLQNTESKAPVQQIVIQSTSLVSEEPIQKASKESEPSKEIQIISQKTSPSDQVSQEQVTTKTGLTDSLPSQEAQQSSLAGSSFVSSAQLEKLLSQGSPKAIDSRAQQINAQADNANKIAHQQQILLEQQLQQQQHQQQQLLQHHLQQHQLQQHRLQQHLQQQHLQQQHLQQLQLQQLLQQHLQNQSPQWQIQSLITSQAAAGASNPKASAASVSNVLSASPGLGSLPASTLQALGGFGGGSAAGGAQIIVKTLELDASDADPSSAAFKAALEKATKEARLELGVSSSEELGVGGADLTNLLGKKKRKKRQLFGGESSSSSQSVGNALSTGAGLFDNDDEE